MNGWLREGSIRCPPCTEICNDDQWVDRYVSQDSDMEKVGCLPDSKPPHGSYIGDVPLDEPCCAFKWFFRPVILIIVIFVIYL